MSQADQVTLLRDYRRLFMLETGQLRPEAAAVLEDLRKFCEVTAPKDKNGAIDPYAMAARVGRMEAYRHINSRLFSSIAAAEQRAQIEREQNDG